jgi:hypothetical protein
MRSEQRRRSRDFVGLVDSMKLRITFIVMVASPHTFTQTSAMIRPQVRLTVRISILRHSSGSTQATNLIIK